MLTIFGKSHPQLVIVNVTVAALLISAGLYVVSTGDSAHLTGFVVFILSLVFVASPIACIASAHSMARKRPAALETASLALNAAVTLCFGLLLAALVASGGMHFAVPFLLVLFIANTFCLLRVKRAAQV